MTVFISVSIRSTIPTIFCTVSNIVSNVSLFGKSTSNQVATLAADIISKGRHGTNQFHAHSLTSIFVCSSLTNSESQLWLDNDHVLGALDPDLWPGWLPL